MKRIQECWDQELVWSRVKPLQLNYELRAGTDVVATLSKGLVASKGDAQSGEGHWIIKREGVFRTRLVVQDAASQSVVATMPWGKSARQVLELSQGGSYPLALFGKSAVHTEAGFVSAAGERLLSVRSQGVVGGHKGTVRIEAAAQSLPDLSLLVCVNWYVILLAIQDAGALSGGLGAAGGGLVR